MSALAPALEAFFTERLIGQRHASPNTVAAYRDSWRLLLHFVHEKSGKAPYQLDLADLDDRTIGSFLEHLETVRGNAAKTRRIIISKPTSIPSRTCPSASRKLRWATACAPCIFIQEQPTWPKKPEMPP